MSEHKAVTKTIARRYRGQDRAGRKVILDALCELTGWHRDHARKALREVLKVKIVRERKARPPIYGEDVIVVLRYCWAAMGTASGKRMAPFLGDLVPVLRAFGELRIADETATAVCAMSAATIDRSLAPDRAKLQVRGRSHTKPGSLLKDSIPMRTWADWDDAVPGFVEIDLVGHEGGNPSGEHAYPLTAAKRAVAPGPARRTGPKPTDAHDVVFYRAPNGELPAREYLASVSSGIAGRLRAVAVAVAAAPPMRFSGGGMWEAMHGTMTGWFEIRVDGPPSRTHYRLFCLLDHEAQGADKPFRVLVDGRSKPFRTTLSDGEYAKIKALGAAYFETQPRPVG